MTLIPFLAVANLLQAPPSDTAWGNQTDGIRMGLAIEQRQDGPPIIDCYVENKGRIAKTLSAKGVRYRAPIPKFILTGNQAAWIFSPPSAEPAVWDGPAWELSVPSGMAVKLSSSRSWFPITAGSYQIKASFSFMARPLQSGKAVPKEMDLDSGLTPITIRPADVHPAHAAGIG